MNNSVYNRCHGLLAAHALLYPFLFLACIAAALSGYEIDTATIVQIVFTSLPQGFIAALVLLGLFNLYVYLTD